MGLGSPTGVMELFPFEVVVLLLLPLLAVMADDVLLLLLLPFLLLELLLLLLLLEFLCFFLPSFPLLSPFCSATRCDACWRHLARRFLNQTCSKGKKRKFDVNIFFKCSFCVMCCNVQVLCTVYLARY